jgi:hypothetical protein
MSASLTLTSVDLKDRLLRRAAIDKLDLSGVTQIANGIVTVTTRPPCDAPSLVYRRKNLIFGHHSPSPLMTSQHHALNRSRADRAAATVCPNTKPRQPHLGHDFCGKPHCAGQSKPQALQAQWPTTPIIHPPLIATLRATSSNHHAGTSTVYLCVLIPD